MKDIITRSFNINIIILRILGLYPADTHEYLMKFLACAMYFIFVIAGSVLVIIYILTQEKNDILQLNSSGLYLAETVCFTTKLLPFLYNGQKIKKCIHYFGNPYFAPKSKREEEIIDECVAVCRRNSIAYVSVVTIAEISWNLKFLYMGNYQMPLDVWLPYKVEAGTLAYWSTYLILAATSVYNGYAGTTIDPVIGGLAYHGAAQLKILKHNVQHLNDVSFSKARKDSALYNKIRKCILHHKAILTFVETYEECFSLAAFSQFAAGAFCVCFGFLQLTFVPLTSTAGFCATSYILVVIGQLYLYCYYGTELYEENNNLRDAVYMGEWYDYDEKSKKALILLMERSKRPMIVTAGKIVDLTVDTFTLILKRSYSLICLLKTYQQ